MQDLATQWTQAYPCKNKTSQETQRSLQKFLEPERKPKVIYTDISLEFGKACEDLSWNHCTSTPHRSETNGIAERAVRRVKEGTSAVLLQSGLDENWWADSMECHTYLRNVTDLLSDGKTPYERRFGQPFKGPIIPFRSLVEYLSVCSAVSFLRNGSLRVVAIPDPERLSARATLHSRSGTPQAGRSGRWRKAEKSTTLRSHTCSVKVHCRVCALRCVTQVHLSE